MAYTFAFKDEASKELIEAFIWYEDQQSGLGQLFRKKVNNKIEKICDEPFQYKSPKENFMKH